MCNQDSEKIATEEIGVTDRMVRLRNTKKDSLSIIIHTGDSTLSAPSPHFMRRMTYFEEKLVGL